MVTRLRHWQLISKTEEYIEAVSYTHLDVYKRQIMNIWENLQIYKHKTQNKPIPEQIQINTKHDTIFKALNIENTQNTKQIPQPHTIMQL